jgi:hypothetical protein
MKDAEWVEKAVKANVVSEFAQYDGGNFRKDFQELARVPGSAPSFILHPVTLIGSEPNAVAALHRSGREVGFGVPFRFQFSLVNANFIGESSGEDTITKDYHISLPFEFAPHERARSIEVRLESKYGTPGNIRHYDKVVPLAVFPSRESITENPLVTRIEDELEHIPKKEGKRVKLEGLGHMIIHPTAYVDDGMSLASRIRANDNRVAAAALYVYSRMTDYGALAPFAHEVYRRVAGLAKSLGIWTPDRKS